MNGMLNDQRTKLFLLIELAVVVDVGRQFVQSTYKLEGDGPFSLVCYEILQSVNESIRIKHFQNTEAVVKNLFSSQPPQISQQWHSYALNCVQPGFDYFCDWFTNTLGLYCGGFQGSTITQSSERVILES